jgi:glyoxylase-like metal-dependent hydrolase (beta-lactamase superfamily II)
MTVRTMRVGDVELTRVGYADVSADAGRVGLTPEQVRAVAWGEPLWADDGQVRVGVAAWIIESGDERIVVDPANVADDILRTDADAATHQKAFEAALSEAGVTRDNVTTVVATHLDGIGMLAWRNDDGSWSPFFDGAPILLSARELDAIDAKTHSPSRTEVLAQVRAAGAVQPVTDDNFSVTDEVTLEFTGAHTPGHQIVRINSAGESAVIVGHLAVSPLHLVTGRCPQQHPDPDRAQEIIEELRDEDGTLLIGPLWPDPGAGRWDGDLFMAIDD